MASSLSFYAGDGSPQLNPAVSGGLNTVGFYGSAHGFSIRVGEFNETTFRTTEDGSTDGGAMPNLRFANPTGAYVAAEIDATELLEVNNPEATLLVRLNTDSAVATQNARLIAFDKSDLDNPPSGVSTFAAEIRKDHTGVRGSGDSTWLEIGGTAIPLDLDDRPNPTQQHQYFIGLTASPDSIGEKTLYALYFETEFL